MRQDRATEATRQREVQREVEDAAAAREVLLDLSCSQVQAGRGAQHPRADSVRELLQNRVVVLAGVGHANQTGLSRGQQERADRGVDGAVGDVEDSGLVREIGRAHV